MRSIDAGKSGAGSMTSPIRTCSARFARLTRSHAVDEDPERPLPHREVELRRRPLDRNGGSMELTRLETIKCPICQAEMDLARQGRAGEDHLRHPRDQNSGYARAAKARSARGHLSRVAFLLHPQELNR